MTAPEILSTLKKLGKPQTAAIYRRHGADKNIFGVLPSEIVKFQKKIKVNHALALELWKTGNGEARILALLVADPAKLTLPVAERWLKDGPVRFLDPYLSGLFAGAPLAEKASRAWTKSPDEWRRAIGYGILAVRLRDGLVSDADAAKALAVIAKQIHASPNYARHKMNNALIAIGIYKPLLRQQVMDAAKRIGVVHVDHGETGCKTPDAIPYIEKAVKRKQ